jgi:hypothetical protein
LASTIRPDGEHHERNQPRECGIDTGHRATEYKQGHRRNEGLIRVHRLARDDTNDLIDCAGGGSSVDHVDNGEEQQGKQDLEDHSHVELPGSRYRRGDRSTDSTEMTRAIIGIRLGRWRRGDAHGVRSLAGVLSRERENRSRLARYSSLGSLLRLRSGQHGTLGVAVLAVANLAAD